MTSRVAGIGPSPRLLMLCFLPLTILIAGMGMDQYVRQRAALLTDLAGIANERHGLISAAIDGAGPQLTALRLSMGLDNDQPPIGTLVLLDRENRIAGINGQVSDRDLTRLRDFVGRSAFKARSVEDTPGLTFESHPDFRSLVRTFGQTGYKLVYLVPDMDLRTYLLPRFAPFLVILAGLAATVAGIFYILHRSYILPSLKLARYVSDQASGTALSAPVLPYAWRKHLGLIGDAFM